MTKNKKLDAKIIRVGDVVRINNPEMFVRCGYPMSLEDGCKEVEDLFSGKIRSLIDVVAGEDQLKSRIRISKSYKNEATYQKIIKELAYVRLRKKNFGGQKRQIITETDNRLKDVKAQITAIRFVKTGIYVGPSKCYDYYNGGYEYDPPYLDDQKTHKILELSITNNRVELVRYRWNHPTSIEDIHVTKIMDKE